MAEKHKKEKIGRNDPCPCGSGKKYKKCCLGKEELKQEVKNRGQVKIEKLQRVQIKEKESLILPENLKKFLIRDTNEIKRKVSEKNKLFKEEKPLAIKPFFIEFCSFIHFRDDKDGSGEKVYITSFTPHKLQEPCICGSGKQFGSCCFEHSLNRKAFAINYDKKTYDLADPKTEEIEADDFDVIRVVLSNTEGFVCSENTNTKGFFNFVGEDLLITEFGAMVFGTVEIKRNWNGKAKIVFEGLSKKRHELMKGRVQAIVEAVSMEKKFKLFMQKFREAEQIGDHKKAAENLDKVLEVFPEDIEALNEKARLTGIMGKEEDGIKMFDQLIKEYGKEAAFFGNKGLILMRKKKFDEAMECLDTALSLQPNAIPALNNKGVIHSIRGELGKAMECFDKTLALDKNNVFALIQKGLALQRQGKPKEADNLFDKAVRTDAFQSMKIVTSAELTPTQKKEL